MLLAACAGSDDPPVEGIAACDGGDRFVLDGAFAIDSEELGPVTVEDKVAGFMGAAGGGNIFSLTKRHVPLDGDFDEVGVHDIAGVHVKYLEFPFNSDCSVSGTCHGFFALAGTVEVLEVSPRFRATFSLTELVERSDNTDEQGAPIAGTVTGCVDSRREP